MHSLPRLCCAACASYFNVAVPSLNFHTGEKSVARNAVPGNDFFIVMFKNMNFKIRLQNVYELDKAQSNHGVLVMPNLRVCGVGFFNADF